MMVAPASTVQPSDITITISTPQQYLYFDDNDGRTSLYSPTIRHYNNNINSTAIFRAGISSAALQYCGRSINLGWPRRNPLLVLAYRAPPRSQNQCFSSLYPQLRLHRSKYRMNVGCRRWVRIPAVSR